MPLLKPIAESLTNNDLVAGVIEEIIEKDQLFAQLPFTRVDGKAYVYNREDPVSWAMTNYHDHDATTSIEADFLDPNDTVNERAAKFIEVTAKLRAIIGDVDVDKFLQTTMNNTNDQRAIQIAQKAKALGRKFRRTLVIGDNATYAKEFDGIAKMTTAGQTIAAGGTGSPISFDLLDQLLDAVPNGADAIIMRPGTLRIYRGLLRALGGVASETVMIENFGMPVPAHNGVPILVNEFLPASETYAGALTGGALASVYAVRFNEVDGLHGLYGGEAGGIVVEDLGTVQTKDATRTRLKWYTGLALKSTKSIARIRGVSSI